MAGIFDYKRYINIFATAQDVLHIFPRDQRSITFDFDGVGADGWSCDIDWMTLIIDSARFNINNEPDFSNSRVIGFFPGSVATVPQTGTTIILPADMYTGPMLPGFPKNIPVTAVNINWTKGMVNFQRQFLLIQNWEPGTAIGNPEDDENYTPIVDSFPITVEFSIDPSTTFTDTTITVIGTATSIESFPIGNIVSALLVAPQYDEIPNALLTTTNFIDGVFTATFIVGNNWIEEKPVETGIYTILTSTLTTSSYSIVADITRTHNIYLQWRYDQETGYRGGKTASQILTVTTTRSFTYEGQLIELSLTANTVNQRIGNTSTFTVSHDANETLPITGVVELIGTVFYSTATAPMPVSLGTGTFNADKQCVFSSILNTGTYTLQAIYSGNIGDNIFRPMYLSTVSNSIVHYVAFGREFALTEMLIEETTNTDYVYAHAIDDGRTTGDIGGLVTFYQDGNSIGTGTFVRHSYEYPVEGGIIPITNIVRQSKAYTTMPRRGTYPWPYEPIGGWPNNPPYGRYANAIDYAIANVNNPTYFANFKQNSNQLDWPPTFTPINTIGIVADDGSVGAVPVTGQFAIEFPIPNIKYNNVPQDGIYMILTEFVGYASIPSYPAQTLNIRDDRDPNKVSFVFSGNQAWTIWTAPNGPFPRYDNNSLTRGQVRPNGTKYFSVTDTVPIVQAVDLGDVWPSSYTGQSSPNLTNIMVFKFKVRGYVYDAKGFAIAYLNEDGISAPQFINTSTFGAYGLKTWQDFTQSWWRQPVLDIIQGITRISFNAIADVPVTSTTTDVVLASIPSRSHLATLQLPKGIVSTGSVFTATFAGTLDAGIEGYFPEGISFIDNIDSKFNLLDEGKENYQIVDGNYYPYTTVPFNLRSMPNYSITNWFIQTAFNDLYQPWLYSGKAKIGRLFFYSDSTGTIFENILTPEQRYYPQELSQNYVKRLGWLNRRAPQGRTVFNFLNPDNTSTIFTSWIMDPNNPKFSIVKDNRQGIQQVQVVNQILNVDPQINLPPPLRYNNNNIRSQINANDPGIAGLSGFVIPADFNRLDILNTSSYTSQTTSTLVYPVKVDFISTVSNVNSSSNFNILTKTPITWDRGTTISWNNSFSNVDDQKYLLHQGIATLPWRLMNLGGGKHYWTTVITIGSVNDLFPSLEYRIKTPRLMNPSGLWWSHKFVIEKWTPDGTTLLSTTRRVDNIGLSPIISATRAASDWIYRWNGLSPFGVGLTEPSGVWNRPKTLTVYWSIFEDIPTSIPINQWWDYLAQQYPDAPGPEPSEPFGPFLFKYYIVLNTSSVPPPRSGAPLPTPPPANTTTLITPVIPSPKNEYSEWVFENYSWGATTGAGAFITFGSAEEILFYSNQLL